MSEPAHTILITLYTVVIIISLIGNLGVVAALLRSENQIDVASAMTALLRLRFLRLRLRSDQRDLRNSYRYSSRFEL